MSSGFVAEGGASEQPAEPNEEWVNAQRAIEESRKRKAEVGQQADGKSLFEVLQQNKGDLGLEPRPNRSTPCGELT